MCAMLTMGETESITIFQPFPRLPIELREEIWRLCLPADVVELDLPLSLVVFDTWDGSPCPCDLARTTNLNTAPPLIARVCHESRRVAFENGSMTARLVSNQVLLPPEDISWYTTNTVSHDFWQPKRGGLVYLNWTEAYEGEYICPEDTSPLPYLVWASHNASQRPCAINFQYLEQIMPASEMLDEELKMVLPLEDAVLRDLDTMKQLPVWLVVMKTIVVHASRKDKGVAASGLFGLLGDAPIRIFDVTDSDNDEEITALAALADVMERRASVEPRKDCSVPLRSELQGKLRKMALLVFRDEDVVERLRPAVMFRHCDQMCNNRG